MRRLAWLLLLALPLTGPVAAHSYEAGDLHIAHPWARATAPGAPTGAVYFTIETRAAADRLIGVSTPMAERAQMHRSIEEEGSSRMEHVDSVSVRPDAPLEFAPGGLHVMLIDLQEALVEGDDFPLTLRFGRAGEIEVEVRVEGMTTSPPGAGEHAH